MYTDHLVTCTVHVQCTCTSLIILIVSYPCIYHLFAAAGLSGESLVRNVFCKLCQLIKEGLNQLEKSRLEDLFKVLESVNASMVQHVSTTVRWMRKDIG